MDDDSNRWTLGVYQENGKFHRISKREIEATAAGWRGAGRALRDGVAAENLAEAGWGVVFSSDHEGELRRALAPLLEWRQDQAGELFQQYIYRSRESSAQFRQRLRSGFGPVDPREIPYYLLLVGDIDEIPHAFQAGLDVPHAVGRLHLASTEEYRAYAERVVACESGSGRSAPKGVIFSPSHDDDEATELSVERCSKPLAEALDKERGARPIERWLRSEATRRRFESVLEDRDSSLVFTIGHGTLYPPTSPYQKRLQGSLVCADWSGRGPVQMGHIVEGAALPPDLGLDGRIFFLFGCFTGGTPRLDGFDSAPRDQRRLMAERPFLASLPQKLLERGALAVIAHIDRAFPDAFLWERYGQLGVFQDCMKRLLGGKPVGYAMERFSERYAHLAAELLDGLANPGDGDVETLGLELWTAYQDARGLVTLGDPAVRLGKVPAASRSPSNTALTSPDPRNPSHE